MFENMNNDSQPSFTKYNSCQLKYMVSGTWWICGMDVKDEFGEKILPSNA